MAPKSGAWWRSLQRTLGIDDDDEKGPGESDADFAARILDRYLELNPQGPTAAQTAADNALDRQHAQLISGMDNASREAINRAQIAAQKALQDTRFTFDERMQNARIAADKEMQNLGFTHAEKLQAVEIAAQKALQAERLAQEREFREEDQKIERQKTFTEMLGNDPVRAALFALGISGDPLTGGDPKQNLEALEGAEEFAGQTEQVLGGLLNQGLGADEKARGPVTLGQTGVQGLVPIEKTARTFAQGSGNTRKLLTSAFGVGDNSEGGAGGIDEDEVFRRIAAVTPSGGGKNVVR